ncbi:velvet factor-domain-containing protein [Cryomyces antarcticus]
MLAPSDDYQLEIRQQPKEALQTLDGKEKVRKPVDPPPIVQLRVRGNADPSQQFLQSPYLFMCCSLWVAGKGEPPTGQGQQHRASQTLAGSLVSSLHRLKDINNHDGGFFVFGDLSVKVVGQHRLHFSLFEMRKTTGEVIFHKSITTEPFTVSPPKDWRGMEESTYLSRAFSDQGVRLRLRKEPRAMSQAIKRSFNTYTNPASAEASMAGTPLPAQPAPGFGYDGPPEHSSSYGDPSSKRQRTSEEYGGSAYYSEEPRSTAGYDQYNTTQPERAQLSYYTAYPQASGPQQREPLQSVYPSQSQQIGWPNPYAQGSSTPTSRIDFSYRASQSMQGSGSLILNSMAPSSGMPVLPSHRYQDMSQYPPEMLNARFGHRPSDAHTGVQPPGQTTDRPGVQAYRGSHGYESQHDVPPLSGSRDNLQVAGFLPSALPSHLRTPGEHTPSLLHTPQRQFSGPPSMAPPSVSGPSPTHSLSTYDRNEQYPQRIPELPSTPSQQGGETYMQSNRQVSSGYTESPQQLVPGYHESMGRNTSSSSLPMSDRPMSTYAPPQQQQSEAEYLSPPPPYSEIGSGYGHHTGPQPNYPTTQAHQQ